jgi:hypothetical protein
VSGMRKNTRRKGERLIEVVIGRVVIVFGLTFSLRLQAGLLDNCNPASRSTSFGYSCA